MWCFLAWQVGNSIGHPATHCCVMQHAANLRLAPPPPTCGPMSQPQTSWLRCDNKGLRPIIFWKKKSSTNTDPRRSSSLPEHCTHLTKCIILAIFWSYFVVWISLNFKARPTNPMPETPRPDPPGVGGGKIHVQKYLVWCLPAQALRDFPPPRVGQIQPGLDQQPFRWDIAYPRP